MKTVGDLLFAVKSKLRRAKPTVKFREAHYILSMQTVIRAVCFEEKYGAVLLRGVSEGLIIFDRHPFDAVHVADNLYYDPEFDQLFVIVETTIPDLYELIPESSPKFPLAKFLLEDCNADFPYKDALLELLS